MRTNKEEMKIELIKLSDLKPYERNPRINDDAAAKLQDSIKQFGFRVPMLIDKDNVIVAGHTRYKAAELLGLDEVPCIRIDGLSDDQIKAFRIADNKYSELSSWDFDMLKGELTDLQGVDFNLELLGFNAVELQSYLEPFSFESVEEEENDESESSSGEPHQFPESGRIIITYEKEEEFDFLVEKLRIEGDKTKVNYRAKDLMDM